MINDSSYSFIDTIILNFSTLPINTDDFVSLTNQTYNVCLSQFNRISYQGEKYFYSVKLTKLNSSSNNVTLAISSVFGSKYNPNNDFTPIGQWPKIVFGSNFTDTYYVDEARCDNPYGYYSNGKQAPQHIAEQMNKYKSYLNYDPFYAISKGEPNPYLNMVLGGSMNLTSTAKRYKMPNGTYEEKYADDGNYWDWLLHQRNPEDKVLNDCIDEYNCFKISTLLNNEESYDCVNNTRSKCLSVDECNHYYNRMMNCVLETMDHYNKHYFVNISSQTSSGVCIDAFCSYWMGFTITIGNMYYVETKSYDKLIFPQAL